MKHIQDINGIQIGGVYETNLSNNPVRVLAFDEIQLFYDVWWSHSKSWGCKSNLTGKVFFYRTPTKEFRDKSKFLHVDELSKDEENVYRFDLSFSVCRSKMKWTNKKFPDIGSFNKEIASLGIDVSKLESLLIDKIVLVPFGLKGEHKKSVIIKSVNDNYFSGTELLWNAQNIQSAYIKDPVEWGVGLYRLGFENSLPSFYIGGFYDSAIFLRDYY